jgi:prephenate dehydrogenase
VGLLGGSLGLALKQRGLAARVEGLVRRDASVAECLKLRVVDDATTDPKRAAGNADLLVLCTPIAGMQDLVRQMAPALKRDAIVTDVGSVKASVVSDLEAIVASAGGHFIGSHPMAGSEKTGPAHARGDLFVNAVCVVTPTARSSPTALDRVEDLWKSLGASLLRMPPVAHDQLVSRSSHLPHVIAAQLVNHVLDSAHPKEQAMLCANGFRDATRIASGSPEMWRDIALANRENLARAVDEFVRALQAFRGALDAADARAIEKIFDQAKIRRDAWCAQGVSPSPE